MSDDSHDDAARRHGTSGKFETDLLVLLGIAAAGYEMDPDACAAVMEDVAADLRAGGYELFFAAGPHATPAEDDDHD